MKQRVRAVLLTPTGTTLVMKRVRPGADPYRVLIGGGIEDADATLEAGLLREIREEIAGTGEVIRLFAELTNDKDETEFFYLVSVTEWDFAARTGPEFDHDDRGEYHLEEVPLTTDAIKALNLMPPQVKHLLADAIETGELLGTTA